MLVETERQEKPLIVTRINCYQLLSYPSSASPESQPIKLKFASLVVSYWSLHTVCFIRVHENI